MQASPARVILIGGSSHVGKTTIARALARKIGGEAASTDSLARHPGRPFGPAGVPAHVAEHYLALSGDELLASVMAHYESLAPRICEIVRLQLSESGAPLVLEGSAVLPETAERLGCAEVGAVWLTAPEGLFRDRILRLGRHATADARSRRMIEAFSDRTLAFDAAITGEARRLGLALLEVEEGLEPETLAAACLAAAKSHG